jgi:hypothetical protein
MKAIIIISLAIIVLLLLLRRVSGYTGQCWRGNCTTEQIPDINGNLVEVPNIACLGASSVAEYCTYTTYEGDLQKIVGRDDPNTCSNDPAWQNVAATNARFAQELSDQQAAAVVQAQEDVSWQQAYADSNTGSFGYD